MNAKPIRLTVITGFLGSGKTSLINHILAERPRVRFGLIVNELGALAIDDKLVEHRSDSLITLTNGCVCCSLGADLRRTLETLLARYHDLDAILVETSGVSRLGPLEHRLHELARLGLVQVGRLATVVDAANFDRNLEYAEITYDQLVKADLLVINKLDLVEPKTGHAIATGLRQINDRALILEAINCRVDLSLVLGAGSAREILGEEEHKHAVGAGFEAVVLNSPHPVDLARFQDFTREWPAEVIRAKGVLAVTGMHERLIFQRVGDRHVLDVSASWGDEPPQTTIVVIGRGLRKDQLTHGFQACLVRGVLSAAAL